MKEILNNILDSEQQVVGWGVKKEENSETRGKVEELQVIALGKYIESLDDKKKQKQGEKE